MSEGLLSRGCPEGQTGLDPRLKPAFRPKKQHLFPKHIVRGGGGGLRHIVGHLRHGIHGRVCVGSVAACLGGV